LNKTVTGSNNQKRKRLRNVQGQIGLLLGATFKRGKDTKMSIGRKGCCWEHRSKEERILGFPRLDKTVTGSNIQKRKRHRNVQGKIWLLMGGMSRIACNLLLSMEASG
jgi:hypothetical protein